MSNQNYTQSGQSMDEGMDQGMGQDQYGSMRDRDQMDPRRKDQMDQMGQDLHGQADIGGTSDREYGMSDQYAQSGTLNEGYGQGQQMGEDDWSRQGGQTNQDATDPMRGNTGASASDRFERETRDRAGGGGDTGEEFRDMVGGMYGEGDDNLRDR